MMFEVIDAYCHCGLRKYRPIEEVKRVMDQFDIARSVLVQHMGEYDNEYIAQIVATEPDRFAGVLLVNVENPSVSDHLNHWAARNIFRGIRLMGRTLETHPAIWEQAASLGLSIVLYEEPSLSPYVNGLAQFAEQHSETFLVVSHLGMLDTREAPLFPSHRRIVSLADQPNVIVQVSGMHMFCDPPYRELLPLVEQLMDHFGAERLIYGSNYPVMQEDSIYQAELNLIRTGQFGIPMEAVEKVLGGTARNVWFPRQ